MATKVKEFVLADLAAGKHSLPLALLRPAARNPRRGNVAVVVASLREFGQHRELVVQKSTGQVIVGNHQFKAMQSLGWTEGDCLVVDDDDDKALRRAIADNATGDLAEWEKVELAEVLKDTGPVPGFDEADVDRLLEQLGPKAKVEEPVFPITPRFMEHYSYVVIVSRNETDDAWLQTRFELRREGSYKDQQPITSRVITVDRARELLDGS